MSSVNFPTPPPGSMVSKDLPLVSVVIPAYNAQNLIGETLESLFQQTWSRLEIIVVDDGSIDDTAAVVQRHGDRVIYLRQPNSGSCAVPRNTGMARAQGEFLCFLDADDLMMPDRIAAQVNFLERHPEVGLVFSDYVNFNQFGTASQTHFATCPRLSSLLTGRPELVIDRACNLLAEENFGIASSFMLRRQLTATVPGFDPGLRACEDFHLYYRLARVTPTGILNRIGMKRRIHDSNMSSDPARMCEQGIRAYTDLWNSETDQEARRLLNRYVAQCWADLGRYSANRGRYWQALGYQWKALCTEPGTQRLWQLGYASVRTLALAFKLHRPDDV